ncbi:MAG: 4Fe-4S dicluster domain-containing protein [Candidatus Bipolaricaulota bacterium]
MNELEEKQDEVTRYETDRGFLYIRADNCKGCKYCIEFCPQDVLEESEEFNEKGYHPPTPEALEKCVNCGFCELICPDFAIWTTEEETSD